MDYNTKHLKLKNLEDKTVPPHCGTNNDVLNVISYIIRIITLS